MHAFTHSTGKFERHQQSLLLDSIFQNCNKLVEHMSPLVRLFFLVTCFNLRDHIFQDKTKFAPILRLMLN
jgi:hypothetical protein